MDVANQKILDQFLKSLPYGWKTEGSSYLELVQNGLKDHSLAIFDSKYATMMRVDLKYKNNIAGMIKYDDAELEVWTPLGRRTIAVANPDCFYDFNDLLKEAGTMIDDQS